jgi:hypothetical protein
VIKNDIVYAVCREDAVGQFFIVFGIDGNIISQETVVSALETKPSITICNEKIIMMINISFGVYNNDRNLVKLYEIDQSDYHYTELAEYFSAYGLNYHYIFGKPNSSISVVMAQDVRGYNIAERNNATTNVSIAEITNLKTLVI